MKRIVSHQTKGGSNSCKTMENPRVTSMSPRLTRRRRQQTPLARGQHGFGALIVSMVMLFFFESRLEMTDGVVSGRFGGNPGG
jgi:hypothetical protein